MGRNAKAANIGGSFTTLARCQNPAPNVDEMKAVSPLAQNENAALPFPRCCKHELPVTLAQDVRDIGRPDWERNRFHKRREALGFQ